MSDSISRMTLGRMQNPVRGLLHGAAAVASLVGAVLLVTHSAGGISQRAAMIAFGASLVGLYTVSTLYHSVPWSPVSKQRLQRLDHSMIYVLIAGTYTPMATIVLDGWLRWSALAAVWGIVAVGIAHKLFWHQVGHRFSGRGSPSPAPRSPRSPPSGGSGR